MDHRAGRVVEHLSRHPKAKGLSLTADSGREKNTRKSILKFFPNIFLSPGATGSDL